MKKVLFICFVLVLCVCLGTVCFAQEQGEETDIKSYIQEKIVPVAVGVLTAVIAFVATLYKIASVLKSLKEAGRAIDSEGKIREELKEQAEELKAGLGEVPVLAQRLEELREQVAVLSEILTLGFCSSKEVIESGRGKRMTTLLENAKCKMQNAKLWVVEEADPNNGREVANEKV